ncbi:vacuolar protein sorting-associated protein 62 [Diaporthe amygdali]|uniref:vacuolar protein sorting-associated protein 62 n=1 Tax=Phomopsis amygdali TaxID=1214568 RepID=UPI0022FED0DC|nr:vacuolar protein sorting-associated protein 62 [Diaporthe amygdali]KAJ0118655.1 vacuolar protein sorting-associated protein 62 [Diaporthe amygdali]
MASEFEKIRLSGICRSAAGTQGPIVAKALPPRASMCATFPRDQAAAAALFTTVPDYVTRYAPLVWLHSEDPFRPSDLFQHVRHTTPMVDGEPLDGLPELDLDNLALLNDRGPDGSPVALTAASGEVTHLPAWLLGETPDETGTLHNATACVVILVEFEGESGDLGAFYFYFYSYNRGANITQVLEPIKGMLEGDVEPGMHFGDHVGDWEHNMIRFRDGKPTGIYFSQHSGGAAYEWDDTALTVEHERPIVYSAYGSHANYASPGDHVHDAVIKDHCDRGLRWDPVSSAYFYSFRPLTSELTRIFPPGSPQEPNFTSAIYFSGLWGDAQYPDSDPRQETVPRFGLKRYVSGPSGPITKQLVRKGLSPDHREPKTWVQWGVSLFMSLYPCCLRGWRVWASGMILICVLVLIVFGIIYAVRRYGARKEGYQKVDTGADIPLNNLDYRDDTIVHGHRSQGDQQ